MDSNVPGPRALAGGQRQIASMLGARSGPRTDGASPDLDYCEDALREIQQATFEGTWPGIGRNVAGFAWPLATVFLARDMVRGALSGEGSPSDRRAAAAGVSLAYVVMREADLARTYDYRPPSLDGSEEDPAGPDLRRALRDIAGDGSLPDVVRSLARDAEAGEHRDLRAFARRAREAAFDAPLPSPSGVAPTDTTPPSPPRGHSDDYATVWWDGRVHTFPGAKQRQIVEVLWQHWESGGRGLQEATIAAEIESEAARFRIVDAFRRNPALNTLIRRVDRGIWALGGSKAGPNAV